MGPQETGREGGREGERDRDREIYYSRTEVLGNNLYILAAKDRFHYMVPCLLSSLWSNVIL